MMLKQFSLILIIGIIYLLACNSPNNSNTKEQKKQNPPNVEIKEDNPSATKDIVSKEKIENPTKLLDYDTSQWTELIQKDPSIIIDIRYATTNNFVKEKLYDCPRCFLKPAVAAAVLQAQQLLKEGGLGLKMFDCYRPRPIQQKLWDKIPNASYVTPPWKGSMHNRGAAVDLTIVDADGKELNMGTGYDFFGRAAHQDNYDLPKEVLANRKLLKTTMAKVGLKHIRTEWWHYSFYDKEYELSDWLWNCENAK